MSEHFYDTEIAPKLLELGKLCQANGLSMLAVVEWKAAEGDGHEHGRTFVACDGYSPFTGWLKAASECRDQDTFNLDKFVIAVARACHGKPHQSIVLAQLGIPARPD